MDPEGGRAQWSDALADRAHAQQNAGGRAGASRATPPQRKVHAGGLGRGCTQRQGGEKRRARSTGCIAGQPDDTCASGSSKIKILFAVLED
ncbi:hypothetical protein NDU88_003514 [Pleurodeles waltl]|uniref:Uncharacterized protein n=1 Tax=Pleurodeles waltl TaxID=8319 RepID=A0AAV7KVQ5_PLEWA|nr:hypothetical protein NDU88_003514 [Pleurodeles waltl]